MTQIDPASVRQLGTDIQTNVTPTLEEAGEILPNLRSIDQTLYTSVAPALALAYTTAVSYMNEMVEGAAECFTTMNENLASCATSWEDSDQACAKTFS
ncbi:hypothetical protein [Glycomyces dulcitolivorans]|jgi:hypothetical protein|uniref:hypothetical protein n=1 Tax=Glycomyces dulcitolivorans TaxID=2200759 RepID=UPI000DD4A1E5|nr:hypothetical protein [Glycomyces dulcitolivorans]